MGFLSCTLSEDECFLISDEKALVSNNDLISEATVGRYVQFPFHFQGLHPFCRCIYMAGETL